MKLREIRAKNFLTYEDLKYNFVDRPLMIQGLNLTDDKQKSNGSGKSSIQAIIEFCITGDNSRGVRDAELIRFGCKESLLDLFVVCNTRKEEIHINWTIKSKGSNLLSITKRTDGADWEEVVFSNINDGKKWILSWFAISKEDLFNYFIINKARFKSFFKSSNKEKVELINRFSDASVIEGIDDVDSLELDEDYIQLNAKVLRTEGKIEVQKENLQKEHERDLELEFNDKVDQIKEDNLEIDEDVEDIGTQIIENEELITSKTEKINAYNEDNVLQEASKDSLDLRVAKIDEEFISINKTLQQAQLIVDNFIESDFNSQKLVHKEKITGIESGIEDKEEALKKTKLNENKVLKILSDLSIKLMGTITCPKCSHEFLTSGDLTVEQIKDNEKKALSLKSSIEKGKETTLKEISTLESSKDDPKKSIKEIDKLQEKESENKTKLLIRVNEVNSEINKKNTELNNLKKEVQLFVDKINKNTSSIATAKNSISTYRQSIKDLNAEIENYKKEKLANANLLDSLKKNDNKAEIKSIIFSISLFEKEKVSYEKELKDVEDKLYKLNQWKNNFKQFKMHIANKSLETMEFHCNRYLDGMGSDLKAKFEGYKVLANGTVKDEITAKVIRNQERTFSSFSGGEQGRLLFSSILANRHMINNTHPYGGLEFLSIDEVFEGVDSAGLKSLVEEAKKLQTCIMIITHITDEDINEDVLMVVKRNGISKIE